MTSYRDPEPGAQVPLSELVLRIEAGKSFGGAAPPAGPNEWGVVKVSAMTWGAFKPEENKQVPIEAANPKYEIQANDLLLSRANTSDYVGASVIVGASVRPRLLLSDKSLRLVPADGVEPRWLQFMLASPPVRSQISQRATGTKDSMRNISQASLLQIRMPRPTLEEQHRIVEILEDHLSHLDGAMQEITTAVAKARNLELSALRRVRQSFLEAAVPQVRIGDVCQTSLGKMLDAKRANGVATPYLRNINVRWGSFDLSDVKSVQLTPAEIDRLQILDGDILVCEGGEPGRCAVWAGGSQQLAFQKALHRVRVKDASAMLPSYVALMIEEAVKSGRADRLLTGTTIKHLPQEKLRTIDIPQAEIEQQIAAVSQLEQVAAARERMVGEAKGISNKCRSLRQAVLQAAFAGRLTRAC